MKLTKCENRHFYDADRYSTCPHCEKKSPYSGKSITDRPGENPSNSQKKRNTLSPHTGSLFDQAEPKKTELLMYPNDYPNTKEMPNVDNEDDTLGTEIQDEVIPKNVENETKNDTPTLKEIVTAVLPTGLVGDVKTVAFYNIKGDEPVVGWIVCIKGEYFGQSFNLKTGHNNIGRSLDMDVPLAKELSISRNKHAIITYEPKKRLFFLKAGESSGLTYLNGELVMAFIQINAYDKIGFGSSEYVFIPCCSEKFTWEDYIK